jgi:hypothetical protein
MATIANQRWISIRNIIIYLETKFRPNRRIFLFWWPFWIQNQNGRHSKPTMNINLQHHNLLRNQISPKSEDFCIWRPFCTLVTMATVTILINPPKATVDIPTKFHEVRWKESKKIINPPFLFPWQSLSNRFRFFLAYLVPLDVDVVWQVTCYDHFCVFQSFSILAVPMATVAILKIPKVVCTSTHSG